MHAPVEFQKRGRKGRRVLLTLLSTCTEIDLFKRGAPGSHFQLIDLAQELQLTCPPS